MIAANLGQSGDQRRKRPRKQRQPKACYPCRQRKVKCDGIPCSNCTLRGEHQLCSMEEYPTQSSSPVQQTSPLESTPSSTPGSYSRNLQFNSVISPRAYRPSHSLDTREVYGPLVTNSQQVPMVQTPTHILPTSAPTLVTMDGTRSSGNLLDSDSTSQTANNSPALEGIPEQSRLLLGRNLSCSVSSPFSGDPGSILPLEDVYSASKSLADICLALPSDNQIQRYYQMYADTLLPIFPGVIDRDLFETQLRTFLDHRDEIVANARMSHSVREHDAFWFALLFAVLACGAQSLSTVDNEAELNCKVFGSVSLACLRKGNFLVYPTTNSIQALLHIGSSLRNDMNPGVAWSLLGLTIRHAQIIGCHEDHTPLTATDSDRSLELVKQKIWWAVVWQDIILTLCYGYPSGTLSVRAQLPPISEPNGYYTFKDVVNRVCNICLDFFRRRLFVEDDTKLLTVDIVLGLVRKLQEITMSAQTHLRELEACRTVQDHVEHLVARIYVSHAISQILLSTVQALVAEDQEGYEVHDMITSNSVMIIEAYLKLRQLSVLSSHYWSLLHASIVAAKTLLTRAHEADRPRILSLVNALISSLQSSCGSNAMVVNRFSTSLSQTIAEITGML